MNAVRLLEYGGQLVFSDVPTPMIASDEIYVIDGSAFYPHQNLVARDRRRRYIVEHQLPTVFQHSDSLHASSP